MLARPDPPLATSSSSVATHTLVLNLTPSPPSDAADSESVATYGSLRQTPLELSPNVSVCGSLQAFKDTREDFEHSGLNRSVETSVVSHDGMETTSCIRKVNGENRRITPPQSATESRCSSDDPTTPMQPHAPQPALAEQVSQNDSSASFGSVESGDCHWQLTLDTSTCTGTDSEAESSVPGSSREVNLTPCDEATGKKEMDREREHGLVPGEGVLDRTPVSKRRKTDDLRVDEQLTLVRTGSLKARVVGTRRLFGRPDLPQLKPRELFVDLTQDDSDEEQDCIVIPLGDSTTKDNASLTGTNTQKGSLSDPLQGRGSLQLSPCTELQPEERDDASFGTLSRLPTNDGSLRPCFNTSDAVLQNDSQSTSPTAGLQCHPSILRHGSLSRSAGHIESCSTEHEDDSQRSGAGSLGAGSPHFLPPTPGQEDVDDILDRNSVAFS